MGDNKNKIIVKVIIIVIAIVVIFVFVNPLSVSSDSSTSDNNTYSSTETITTPTATETTTPTTTKTTTPTVKRVLKLSGTGKLQTPEEEPKDNSITLLPKTGVFEYANVQYSIKSESNNKYCRQRHDGYLICDRDMIDDDAAFHVTRWRDGVTDRVTITNAKSNRTCVDLPLDDRPVKCGGLGDLKVGCNENTCPFKIYKYGNPGPNGRRFVLRGPQGGEYCRPSGSGIITCNVPSSRLKTMSGNVSKNLRYIIKYYDPGQVVKII